MEPSGDDSNEQSASRKEDNVEEANDLLEECWFSDPHSNSSGLLKANKATEGNGFAGPNLVRAPSLPLHIGRQETIQVKQSGGKSSVSKLTRETSHQKMLQTPTQPSVCIGKRTEGVQDGESDIRRSRVNGQPVRHNLLRTPCHHVKEEKRETKKVFHKITRGS